MLQGCNTQKDARIYGIQVRLQLGARVPIKRRAIKQLRIEKEKGLAHSGSMVATVGQSVTVRVFRAIP